MVFIQVVSESVCQTLEDDSEHHNKEKYSNYFKVVIFSFICLFDFFRFFLQCLTLEIETSINTRITCTISFKCTANFQSVLSKSNTKLF